MTATEQLIRQLEDGPKTAGEIDMNENTRRWAARRLEREGRIKRFMGVYRLEEHPMNIVNTKRAYAVPKRIRVRQLDLRLDLLFIYLLLGVTAGLITGVGVVSLYL